MNPEIDPAEDRDEFVLRLESRMMKPCHFYTYVEALMDKDTDTQRKCIEEYTKQKAKVGHYLELYDKADTVEKKRKVIRSVTVSYEPTDLEKQKFLAVKKKDLLKSLVKDEEIKSR